MVVEGVVVGVDSPGKNEPGSLPGKTGEVGACKDLEQNVFTIGSGNKGKDGDLLRTPKEKLALYIGTNYGDDVCQEWQSEKQLVLQEPTYPDSVLARPAVREKAGIDRVTKMVTSLKKQLAVIEAKLLLTPRDLNLLKSQMEVESKLKVAKFELTDVIEVKNTSDEGMAVGTLKDGYIRKVPLPRVPRIQSASHMCYTHDTCYSEQVTRIPTWSDLVRSLAGLGRSTLQPFSLLVV